MEHEVIISAQNTHVGERTAQLIRDEAEHLEHYFTRIVGCDVRVEGPSPHHRHGGNFRVSIDLRVPGPDVHVSHIKSPSLPVAIRRAFKAAQRQLHDATEIRRGVRGRAS